MKKPSVVRLYTFSDATLVTTGKEKIAFMRRDATAFTPFGITATLMTSLETAINAFSNTITDIEAVNSQAGVTASKDAKADQLRVAIRTVMARVELKYGTSEAKYKKFGTEALSKQSDSDLLITGKRVVRVGTEFLAALTANGLTAAMLTTITTLCNEFETLIIDLKIKIGERDIMQEDRVEAGNTIYKTLVKYTTIGLSLWETSDVAKYNDYVIYNTINSEVPEVAAPLTV
ncbi:hypothetical protein [Flavobacterium sp. 5]|uniref:hypothetical protein n=1 Tax=Flavobacterium sp. 5 TaxID=2035199 RepID=UPI000C2C69ED|nr:hypothetical protein [Flavobacterium sp. 5]PKB17661.1 hypothetical protein CLU82_2882 [Flavobacterium sp. 5]